MLLKFNRFDFLSIFLSFAPVTDFKDLKIYEITGLHPTTFDFNKVPLHAAAHFLTGHLCR